MMQRELCAWAAAAFALSRPPAPSTVRSLIKGPNHNTSANPTQKTIRRVQNPDLEAKVVKWIDWCAKIGFPAVTGATIRMRAAQIRDSIVQQEPDTASSAKLRAMVFSDGWLDKLKQRHGIKSRNLHGEAGAASAVVVDAGRASLREATRDYSKQDIFNMDETAYYYCSVPARSHTKQGFYGLKVLGVQYDNSGKGWMTTALFQRWIEEFNNQMRDEKRRALLLLDNASSHRIGGTLSNVTIHMLHPNTTSHLQPQDAGVIRSFKAQIERIKNLYVLDKLNLLEARSDIVGKENIQRISKSFFDIDVLTAIRWAHEAWGNVTRPTVANCWRRTAILDDDLYELISGMDKLHVSALAIRQLV